MNGNTIKIILSNNPIRDWAKEQVREYTLGALDAISQLIVELSYSVALVGSGISIILWVAGWKNGSRWSGILLVAHVLIRYLYGGV